MAIAANTVVRTTFNGSLYVGMNTSTVGHVLLSGSMAAGLRSKGQAVWKNPSTSTIQAYNSARNNPVPNSPLNHVSNEMVSVNRQ